MRTYCITQGTILNALWDLNGKEIQKKKAYIYIGIADSLCCALETNNFIKQVYSNKIFF